MPRRHDGQPVENEERVAVAALRLSNRSEGASGGRFWSREVQSELAEIEPGAAVNDSTVNRVLNRLVDMGWMSAAWETADPGDRLSSKPRLYFRLTEEGRVAAKRIVAEKRRTLPLWALFPAEVLGEPTEDFLRASESSRARPRVRR
jgi:DNA-binding PadR family transcriptional regulator